MKATVHSSKEAFIIRVLHIKVRCYDLFREIHVFNEGNFVIVRQNFEVRIDVYNCISDVF